MNTFRTESDLLGDKQIPNNAYYGVQTQRAIENFNFSNHKIYSYPLFIKAFAIVKKAVALSNFELKILDEQVYKAIIFATDELIAGKYQDQFPIDLFQGGAGTSTNMNANEVIANIALEYWGKAKGEYQFCSPNDHVNLSQSTNDAYPTALKLAIYEMNKGLIDAVQQISKTLLEKAVAFKDVIKMGRTQLQDAVPMTMGQEFHGFSYILENEIKNLQNVSNELLEVNMGATAIGTGINAVPGFSTLCAANLTTLMGVKVTTSPNLVAATSDTSSFVAYASQLKRLALKLIKICNDLRLLSSGPRTGLFEINLPPMQPGSSIMPGKVNPVIPEVVNQICYKVIGNELTVTLAAENAQLQLNVMEPIIALSIFESITLLQEGILNLDQNCIKGITANKEHTRQSVLNSVGIVTALNPYIGYKTSTKIAKEALETGKSVYQLVLEKNLTTKEKLDEVLDPSNMVGPE